MSIPKTPLAYGAPAYTVSVTRVDYAGRKQTFKFEDYGILRECLDDIEVEVEKRGWLTDETEST